MVDLNDDSLIGGMGGKVSEQHNSSLNTEEKSETQTTEVADKKTTTDTETKTGTEEANKTATTAATETKAEEKTATASTETQTDKATEVEEEMVDVKGWDIVESVDKQFREQHGLSLMEAREIINTDYSKMEETDIVEEYLIFNDPGITDGEIESKMRKYMILFPENKEKLDQLIADGKMTTDDVKDLNAEFDGLLRRARTELSKFQADVSGKFDNFQIKQKKQTSPEDTQKKLIEDTNTFLQTYSSEKIDIKDADGKVVETINFNINDADKKLVSEIMADPSVVYKLWIDENGFNAGKMVRDIYRLRDSDKINQLIYNQALAKGASKEVKDLSNMNFEKKPDSVATGEKLPQAIIDQLNSL